MWDQQIKDLEIFSKVDNFSESLFFQVQLRLVYLLVSISMLRVAMFYLGTVYIIYDYDLSSSKIRPSGCII